ncbi:MAG: hypothetical protein ACI87O_001682 [Planctomycetota bacterium]
MDTPVRFSTLKIMYKYASLLLAFAMATPVWAQSPSPKTEPKAVQVKLVRVVEGEATSIELMEEVGAPQRLQRLLAVDANLTHDDRGYLGIYLGGDNGQVRVGSVSEGSGAEKAGLQAGDLILRINKQDVTSTDQLIKALGEYKSGESVAIQAKRGAEQILFMVQLGERPEVTQGLEIITTAPEGGVELHVLKGMGYSGDAEEPGHEPGTEKKGEHRIELIDGRELGLDAIEGLEISDERMKALMELLKAMEGHDGAPKELGLHTWLTSPEVEVELDYHVQVESESEENESSPRFEWIVGDREFGGEVDVQLHWSKEAPQCDVDKGSCCEKDANSCCDKEASSCCDDAKSQCDGNSECDRDRDRHGDRFDPSMRNHLRTMMGGRRGDFMKRMHRRMMEGHGMQEMHRMQEIHGEHGRSGIDQEPMIEALREMTHEMRSMRKEMKQLRQQVAKMSKAKAKAKSKGEGKGKGKSKSKKATKGKRERHSKSEHAGIDSFTFEKPQVVSKKVIVFEAENGERTVKIIED